MPPGFNFRIEIGNHQILFGCTNKVQAARTVIFPARFASPPDVVITPMWRGSDRNVGHAETLSDVSTESFRLTSDNGASNYFVNWVAMGTSGDRPASDDRTIRDGNFLAQFGRVTRARGGDQGLAFPTAFGAPPSVQLSPHWERRGRGVGSEETAIDVAANQTLINSGNAGDDYFVHWMAAGSADDSNQRVFPVGERGLIQVGRTIKRGPTLRFDFGERFSDPPIVVATPDWRAPVGHAETVSTIDETSFSLISGNAADDYRVSWLAVGLRP